MRPDILPGASRPLLFAHRGISSIAPENTMASFKLARERGIPGVELDVHLTSDGKLVVFHDHDTGRIVGAEGLPPGPAAKGHGLPLEATSYADLLRLDLGVWKGAEYAGQRMLLLSELFEEFGDAIYYDVELKSKIRDDYGLEAATARAIREAMGGKGLLERCVVSSFNPVSLARFKTLERGVPTAIIWCTDEGVPGYLRHGEGRWIGKVDFLKPDRVKVRGSSAFRWRKLEGYDFLPWTVDEPAEGRRLLELGAIGLISNRPHELGVL